MLLHSKRVKWPIEIKKQAIELRKINLSYGEIMKRLNVSRSTLFGWIGGMTRLGYKTEKDKNFTLDVYKEWQLRQIE